MKHQWLMLPMPSDEEIERFYQQLKIDKTLLRLLYQRGVNNYQQAYHFFRPSPEHLFDPFLMKDMDRAVSRIEQALSDGERILVYGDYDVDGTTSVAMMSTYLERFSSEVATYIPDRYSEGYGVSFDSIDFAVDNDIRLVIALDCGIKDIDKISYAKNRGIDFIICDHHLPGETIPEAVAVLNPKQNDCQYPYKELSGCAVGFKLIQALQGYKGGTFEQIAPLLSFVAISIAADIVPMTGENRVLEFLGLQQINASPPYGVAALLSDKALNIGVQDIVFKISPRINAAGRINHANYALELLKSVDALTASKCAETIEQLNTIRKDLDQQITKEALFQIEDNGDENKKTTVVMGSLWHKGVIGIVASRLIETYYRPTIVFTEKEGVLFGSARSIEGIDIHKILTECKKYILQFGGHKSAAGLSIKKEDFQVFKTLFEAKVSEVFTQDLRYPKIKISQYLNFSEITPKWYKILEQFAPFGPENRTPVFLTRNLKGEAKKIGVDKQHLKIRVYDEKNCHFDAVGFNLGSHCDAINQKKVFSMVYCIEKNVWKNRESLQLRIKDISFD